MTRLIEALLELEQAVELTAEALMHSAITKTEAKHRLIGDLCASINDFVLTKGIDTFLYTYPCTDAIYRLSLAKNDEQVAKVCLELIKWTAETIHELTEDEYYE